MARGILGVVAGLLVWVAVASIGGLAIRASWPAYAGVEAAMAFTLSMLLARLLISCVATLACGLVTAVVAPRSKVPVLITALLLLGSFIPVHVRLWDKFPAWYHLMFLLSLVPLTYLGAMLPTWIRRAARTTVPPGPKAAG